MSLAILYQTFFLFLNSLDCLCSTWLCIQPIITVQMKKKKKKSRLSDWLRKPSDHHWFCISCSERAVTQLRQPWPHASTTHTLLLCSREPSYHQRASIQASLIQLDPRGKTNQARQRCCQSFVSFICRNSRNKWIMDDCFNSNLNISMATKTEKPACSQ